jgi:hypothetical protein
LVKNIPAKVYENILLSKYSILYILKWHNPEPVNCPIRTAL